MNDTPPPPTPAGRRGYRWRMQATPWLFLAPYLVLASIFFIYPFFYSIVLAFFQTNGPISRVFVGLDNFRFILGDADFHTALYNTVLYAAASVFLQLPVALGLALLLNSRRDKMKGFFRLVLFSPNLVGQVFVGVLFGVLFVPRFGLFNRFAQALLGVGLETQWLQNSNLILPALILTACWMYVGFNMIYFLAGLQSVDQSLVDAARIDGANAWQVFLNVTIPAIKPVATFVVVMSTIGSFQLFELPYVLLRSTYGPKNSGLTIVGYLYKTAFDSGDLGTGAAIGWILALIIFTFSMAQIRISGTLRKD